MKTIKELGVPWILGAIFFLGALILAPIMLEADYVNQPMDRVEGSFTSAGFVAEPFILDLALFNFSKSTEVALSEGDGTTLGDAMTPQVEHQLTFNVGYEDGMGGDSDNPLENFFINIRVLYLEDCPAAEPCTEAELIEAFNSFNATTPDAGLFRYDFEPSSFSTVTDGTIHTWKILEGTNVSETNVNVPAPDGEPTDTVVSGYAIDFRFVPSKTAMEDFEDGSWVVMIEFGIDDGPSGYDALRGFTMEWYGEIDVAVGTEAIWTGLDVQDFVNNDQDFRPTNLTNTSVDGWQGLRYISNGPYIHTKRASATTWTSDRGFEATLVNSTEDDKELEPQEFMIRINTLNTFDRDLKAIELQSDKARLDLNNMLQRSLEVGREKNFYLFIRLAPNFQNATYTGTIDFGISNVATEDRPEGFRNTVQFMFGDEQYPTERVPLTSRADLEKLSNTDDGFSVFGEGTVYERLYDIRPDQEDFVLAGNIDLDGSDWTPIGDTTNPFTGSLVGNNFEIQNLTITSGDNVGLFGVAQNATFENLVLTNVAITNGGDAVGALVGNATTVVITDVKVDGSVAGTTQVGSIAGAVTQNSQSVLTQLENFATVSGTTDVGGLVGLLSGTLQESINRGEVSASSRLGGLVGRTFSLTSSNEPVKVLNNYNTGTVNGGLSSEVGGLVGELTAGSLENSMNLGQVNGNNAGGVVGSKGSSATIIQSIFKQDSSLNNGVSALGSGSASQALAQASSQLRNVYNFIDWDFGDAWGINVFDRSINDGYPFLQWEGHPIQDIRAEIIAPQGTLTGIQTFTVRAAVGPSHPVGLENWTLELIQDPDNESDEFIPFGATTFGAIGINQNINLDTIFRRNLEHKYLLTVTDESGQAVTTSAVFNIFNPVASGAVNIIEDGDNQIVVNFDSQVSIRDGETLNGDDFVIELFEFNISNLQATPDPTAFADTNLEDGSSPPGTLRETIASSEVDSVTLINNVLTIELKNGITLPAGDRFYFRLTFTESAQNKIVNIGQNPLSTTYARDLVRPLAIRVSDFTSQGLSGSSGWFPRGYTFSVTEPIRLTRLIGGHSGTRDTDIFELSIFEVVSHTNPRPINVNDPIVRFELRGAPTSQTNNHHFAQSEYKIGPNEEGVLLEPGKVYILIQYRTSGGGAHYRAAGAIDYNQINEFNTRITNWGPTTGGNWRFTSTGLDALRTASFHTEETRPSLGFRYSVISVDENIDDIPTRYIENNARPAQD